MQTFRKIIATMSLGIASTTLIAQMTVSPLRLDLSPQNSVATLTVSNNTGPTPLQVQALIKSWTQNKGEDVYNEQTAILLLPPIFGVPVGQSQILRAALLQPNTTNTEQTYRVFLNQFTPQPVNVQTNDNKIETNLNILLNISIPVFVAPNLPENIMLSFTLGTQNKKILPLIVTNNGNTHVHFSKVTLSNGDTIFAEADTPLYVLAGATMTDTLNVAKPLQKGQTYTIKATTDDPKYPVITGSVSF